MSLPLLPLALHGRLLLLPPLRLQLQLRLLPRQDLLHLLLRFVNCRGENRAPGTDLSPQTAEAQQGEAWRHSLKLWKSTLPCAKPSSTFTSCSVMRGPI